MHQRIVVSVNTKSQPIEVLRELLKYSPLKRKKIQFVGWVMALSFVQTPAGTGDDGIGPIVTALVEESPLGRPTNISVQLEGLGKVGVGKNRFCGT